METGYNWMLTNTAGICHRPTFNFYNALYKKSLSTKLHTERYITFLRLNIQTII